MRVIESPAEYRQFCESSRLAGRRVGFVPTMGALHAGHLALIQRAREHADCVLVSIFVNPTQFGQNEDLSRYPRELAADVQKCESAGAAAVFAPTTAAMYLPEEQTRVSTGRLATHLCGAKRPGHFTGVCTVVNKFFCLTGPCCAVFGKKDYQQFKIIERMVADLFLPIELIAHPTVREVDGLALSSRNRLLSAEQRRAALGLPQALDAARVQFNSGVRSASVLEETAATCLRKSGVRIDYACVVDADTLAPCSEPVIGGDRALLALAAFAGETRLIDNTVLGEAAEISGR